MSTTPLPSSPPVTRRTFLRRSTTLGAGLAAASWTAHRAAAQPSPGETVRVAVMGTNGRGLAHINHWLSVKNVQVAAVCDVDSRAVQKGIAAVGRKQEKPARGESDIRRVLDDPEISIVSIAAPNHWHAPATILACAAGKHVYVEKPGSHTAQEGEWMVAAAKRHGRVVQMGNQRRSWPWIQEAMHALHQGEIGKVTFARAWYNNRRGAIGRGQPAPVPDWLNYELWQGPAPERPYKDNLLHYNWHWHWHWGDGELGNNGIHALDLARWGLQVDCPIAVTCGGGRYHFQDDQETPDTCVATFDFGEKGAMWEGHSCDPRGFEGERFGVTFYGQEGSLVIAGNSCRIFDPNDMVVREIKQPHDDTEHFANFLNCIRSGKKPNSDIEDAQKSTLLCHLGNIAFRTGRTLRLDPVRQKIVGDADAEKLWTRDYRPGWEPAK